jgi:hypothetical protein
MMRFWVLSPYRISLFWWFQSHWCLNCWIYCLKVNIALTKWVLQILINSLRKDMMDPSLKWDMKNNDTEFGMLDKVLKNWKPEYNTKKIGIWSTGSQNITVRRMKYALQDKKFPAMFLEVYYIHLKLGIMKCKLLMFTMSNLNRIQKPKFLMNWYDWKLELQDKFQWKPSRPNSNKICELIYGYLRNTFITLCKWTRLYYGSLLQRIWIYATFGGVFHTEFE